MAVKKSTTRKDSTRKDTAKKDSSKKNGIRQTSSKEKAYEIIRQRIMDQEYTSGMNVSILGLSKELGMSNTPIREALNMLVAEGLMTSNLNNKFKVLELNEELMQELNQVVTILARGGYAYVHKAGRDDQLADMLEKFYAGQKKALEEGNEEMYLEQTLGFDGCFVRAANNHKLTQTYDNNMNVLHLCVRYILWQDKSSIERNMHEHEELIRAVRQRNDDLVLGLLSNHFDKHYSEQ